MKTNKLFIAFIVILFFTTAGEARSESPAVFLGDSLPIVSDSTPLNKKIIRKKKAIAIVLALALGPFGVHRLYLGTDSKVSVIYSITLGAFGILPLTDIIAILTTKEINPFQNNKHIIMWIK